jgi:nucleoside-diphosphate-sugar epimerase
MYPLSKKMMEELIQSYIKNYDMDITTLRFFNVFGPRQDIHRKSPPLINFIVREIAAIDQSHSSLMVNNNEIISMLMMW